jgi:hypothetical protein
MHDWFIRPEATTMLRSFPKNMLEQDGIVFHDLTDGASGTF